MRLTRKWSFLALLPTRFQSSFGCVISSTHLLHWALKFVVLCCGDCTVAVQKQLGLAGGCAVEAVQPFLCSCRAPCKHQQIPLPSHCYEERCPSSCPASGREPPPLFKMGKTWRTSAASLCFLASFVLEEQHAGPLEAFLALEGSRPLEAFPRIRIGLCIKNIPCIKSICT